MKENIRSCKADDDRIIQSPERLTRAREKQVEVNAIILQSFSDLQRHGPLIIIHDHEDRTNGSYGRKPHAGNKLDSDDMVRDGRLFDTPDRRRVRHRYPSSSGSDRHDDWHRYHPYRRSDKGYLLDEFKKAKPPTFDGEMNKSQDA